jgi:hypothetical protein
VIRREHLDQIVFQAITDVLNERILVQAVEKVLERLRAGQDRILNRRANIERELSLLDACWASRGSTYVVTPASPDRRGRARPSRARVVNREGDRRRIGEKSPPLMAGGEPC